MKKTLYLLLAAFFMALAVSLLIWRDLVSMRPALSLFSEDMRRYGADWLMSSKFYDVRDLLDGSGFTHKRNSREQETVELNHIVDHLKTDVAPGTWRDAGSLRSGVMRSRVQVGAIRAVQGQLLVTQN